MMASNSMPSASRASVSVLSHLACRMPSIDDMVQPPLRFVPKVPSSSLRPLKSGLLASRN
jgi:hypothetical protein